MLFRHGVLDLVSGYRAWGFDYPSADWLYIRSTSYYRGLQSHPYGRDPYACTHRGQDRIPAARWSVRLTIRQAAIDCLLSAEIRSTTFLLVIVN